ATLTGVRRLAFAPVGDRLAVADGGRVRLLGLADGRPVEQARLEPAGQVVALAVSCDGAQVAGACSGVSVEHPGGVVRVWSTRDGRVEADCRGHTGSVRAVAFGPGGVLASGAEDGTWRLWSADGRETARGGGHGAVVLGVAFSPKDGRL